MSDNQRKPFNAIPIRENQHQQPAPTQTVVVLSADVIRQALGVSGIENVTPKTVMLNSSRCVECSAKGWKKCHHRYVKCLDCNKAMKIFVCFSGDVKRCEKYGATTHTHVECECRKLSFEGKVDFKTRKDQFAPSSARQETNNRSDDIDPGQSQGE